MDEPRAMELLREGEYGFLAFAGPVEQGGYGVPFSYVFDGDCLWFHCAPEGEKLRRIGYSGKASFCMVGRTQVQPDKFTTLYESVMVFGDIEVVEDEGLKREALALLVAKYSPDYAETGAKYARNSLPRTAVLRMKIDRISGKAKKMAGQPL